MARDIELYGHKSQNQTNWIWMQEGKKTDCLFLSALLLRRFRKRKQAILVVNFQDIDLFCGKREHTEPTQNYTSQKVNTQQRAEDMITLLKGIRGKKNFFGGRFFIGSTKTQSDGSAGISTAKKTKGMFFED